MSLLSGKKRNREITLFMSSPSLPNSKIVQLVTCDDKKIDFGSIGLSTGEHDHDALLVTGKVVNNGGHESQDFQHGVMKVIETGHYCNHRGNQLEDINLHKNKKLKESKSGGILNVLNCKRKQLFEDVNQFKKLKINEDKFDIWDKVDELPRSISQNQFTCSYTNKNLKQTRDDEIVAANYKRIRYISSSRKI
ncbi:unnamed protein product [Vicia faba]|uniref:Uncharacterized protein n=1 Tax=Vicia faba TaxID=3906 RepID=A0AAV1AFE2_VICFA|nr:unnamed protein product [Vicia faba]